MDHDAKSNRISRIRVQNIGRNHFFKPVTDENNLFCRLKRNSAVLSRFRIHQDLKKTQNLHSCRVLNEESLEKQSTKMEQSHQGSLQKQKSFSLSLNKNLSISSTLPSIRQSKEIDLPSPRKNFLFVEKKDSPKNIIQGTNLGALSTKQILKKYEIKKIKEELDKRSFLDNYIKNMRLQDYGVDSDSENQESQEQRVKRPFFGKPQISVVSLHEQQRLLNMSQSQQKLTQLLQNRLTDRDYIDFNVKLFQKKDIPKRRYFQRYHNILKKQRQEIS